MLSCKHAQDYIRSVTQTERQESPGRGTSSAAEVAHEACPCQRESGDTAYSSKQRITGAGNPMLDEREKVLWLIAEVFRRCVAGVFAFLFDEGAVVVDWKQDADSLTYFSSRSSSR